MKGTHCMLDFETLGQRPSAVVVSLGAVIFDKTGILSQKDWVFDCDEQIKRGRTIDYSTIQWWMSQGDAARSIFKRKDGVTLRGFGEDFSKFIGPHGDQIKIWGNGADFDVSIMTDIWQRFVQTPLPWKFWNTRCFRTLNAKTGCKDMAVRRGTHHNALDDAIYQAECVIKIL